MTSDYASQSLPPCRLRRRSWDIPIAFRPRTLDSWRLMADRGSSRQTGSAPSVFSLSTRSTAGCASTRAVRGQIRNHYRAARPCSIRVGVQSAQMAISTLWIRILL